MASLDDGHGGDGLVDLDDVLPLVGAEGAVVGGEADGLELGLDSCEEEELQASATESYLRRGLVKQRESVPAASAKRDDLDSPVTLALPAQPTLMASELCPGSSRSPWVRDPPGASESRDSQSVLEMLERENWAAGPGKDRGPTDDTGKRWKLDEGVAA